MTAERSANNEPVDKIQTQTIPVDPSESQMPQEDSQVVGNSQV